MFQPPHHLQLANLDGALKSQSRISIRMTRLAPYVNGLFYLRKYPDSQLHYEIRTKNVASTGLITEKS